eukprot:36846-Pelagomonas_calceolata.AAC.3
MITDAGDQPCPVDASQLTTVEAICREQLAKDYKVSTLEVPLPKAKEINGLRWAHSVVATLAGAAELLEVFMLRQGDQWFEVGTLCSG